MTVRINREDWGSIAQILHWSMAAGIAAMFVCGIAMAWFLKDNIGLKFSVYQFHKSLGFLLLCLAVLRLVWRMTSAVRPAPVGPTKPHERFLAEAVHVGLYACLIAQPLIGWAGVSASPLNIPTVIFGLFTLPRLGQADADWERHLNFAHELVAYALLGLLMLHAAAAFWHHFIRRDETLLRMLPRAWRRPRAITHLLDRHSS